MVTMHGEDFMEPDIMVISVRHIPFRDADEVLSRWNPVKQGYLFSIVAPDKDTTNYLNQKYIPGKE